MKVCDVCDRDYEPRKSDQRYCSEPCRPASNEPYRRLRATVIAMMGGRCVQCGYNDVRALQLDHIDGHGNADPRGVQQRLRAIESGRDTSTFQLLCANCNRVKSFVNRESSVAMSGREPRVWP